MCRVFFKLCQHPEGLTSFITSGLMKSVYRTSLRAVNGQHQYFEKLTLNLRPFIITEVPPNKMVDPMPPPNVKALHSPSVCLNWLCCWLNAISGFSKLFFFKKKYYSLFQHAWWEGKSKEVGGVLGCEGGAQTVTMLGLRAEGTLACTLTQWLLTEYKKMPMMGRWLLSTLWSGWEL